MNFPSWMFECMEIVKNARVQQQQKNCKIDSLVVLRLQEIKFLFDSITTLNNGELEGLPRLRWALL